MSGGEDAHAGERSTLPVCLAALGALFGVLTGGVYALGRAVQEGELRRAAAETDRRVRFAHRNREKE